MMFVYRGKRNQLQELNPLFADNLHQYVEKPNPPAPFPGREGGAGNLAPLSS
jgi:hypothetical protein